MAINTVDELQTASEQFAAAAEYTAAELATMVGRYWAINDANTKRLTKDGDLLTKAQYEKERDHLSSILKDNIERLPTVEGVPPLVLQSRNGTANIDVKSLYERDPESFFRLLESNGLTANMTIVKGLEQENLIAATIPRVPGPGSSALTFDKRGR